MAVAKIAHTTQHYNEVELEKEATVKEYLTVGRIGEGSNLCKNFTSSNKKVHFLHVNGVKKPVPGGEGRDGEGGGEPNKPTERVKKCSFCNFCTSGRFPEKGKKVKG